jgi:hypothetical protein
MTIKDKLLGALDITLEDISEERLLHLLLDAYRAKQRSIEHLESENAREREDMHHEREKIRENYRRMRRDPLYGQEGVYYFIIAGNGIRLSVTIQGARINLHQRVSGMDIAAAPVSLETWLRYQ